MRFRAISIFLLFMITGVIMNGQEGLPEDRISISTENSTVREILDHISLQTGYFFTYNSDLIPDRRKVAFHADRLPLGKALDSLLADTTLDYRFIDRNIVIFRINASPPYPVVPAIDRSLLEGRVVDGRNGDPLDYATVALNGTSLGTVTNQEGGFILKIPPETLNPILVISYLGYRRMLYPVEGEGGLLIIRMERESIPLQEVVIRRADPVGILARAIERIPDNYMQVPSAMAAYYRESVRRNNHCMAFSEAVLDVAKEPYQQVTPADRVRIRKGRKIVDTSAEDTVLVKLRSGIYDAFNLDVIKNQPDFLTESFRDYYDLVLTDMMTYGDRLVYVIEFRQKETIQELLFRGQLYIDQESLVILAADFEYNPDRIQQEPGLFLVSRSPRIHIRPIRAKYHVEYRTLDEIYFVSQVRADVQMRVRKRRQWIGSRYDVSLEMAVTDVVPGEKLRIDRDERVRATSVLVDQEFEFDPLFWGPFNTIEPEASLKESLERMKEKLKLQE